MWRGELLLDMNTYTLLAAGLFLIIFRIEKLKLFQMMNNGNREMNEDELAIFISLRTSNKDKIEKKYNFLLSQSWVLEAISKHSNARNLDIEKSVQILILTISDGAIGYAVKYLDVIKKWSILQNQSLISMDDFCMKIFPFGFPDFSKSSNPV